MDIQNAHRAEREYMKVKARMDKDKAYLARLKESMEGFIEWGFTPASVVRKEYVRQGTIDTKKLYEDAGITPDILDRYRGEPINIVSYTMPKKNK